MAFVTEMLESVFQVKPEDQGIEKMFRLGQRNANNSARGVERHKYKGQNLVKPQKSKVV